MLVETLDELVHRTHDAALATRKREFGSTWFSLSGDDQQAIERVRRVEIGKGSASSAAAEDFSCTRSWRAHPREVEDIRGLLRKNSELDFEYIVLACGV